ncbi:hypothetical protein J2X72_004958 [Phyllobacterium sp. 1468]|nr:hypothetical protein [Phyllobacterium sp. 1468]
MPTYTYVSGRLKLVFKLHLSQTLTGLVVPRLPYFNVFRPLKCGHQAPAKDRPSPSRTVFCLIAHSFTAQLPTSLEASDTSQSMIIPMYNHVHPKNNFILERPM